MDALSAAFIVPNYNGRELLARSLPLLVAEAAGRENLRVVVADDGSADDSVRYVREERPEVELLAFEKNAGFARACNRAAGETDAEILVFLNSDVLAEPGFSAPLLEVFSEKEIFAASPRILREDTGADESLIDARWEGGRLSFRTARAPAEGSPVAAGSEEALYAVGCAMAVRRRMFLDLDGFDPLFTPFFGEDLDLCLRARRRGWRTVRVPASTVRHEHSATISRYWDERARKAALERSRLLVEWLHLGDRAEAVRHLASLLAELYTAPRRELLAALSLALAALPEARARLADRPAAVSSLERIVESLGGATGVEGT